MRGRAISLICQYSYFIPALRLPCLFANAFCHLCLFILVSYLYCLIVNDISFIFCVLKFYYFLILFLMIFLSILPCCLVPFPFMPAASSPSLLPCRWTGRSPAFHLLLICHVATFLSPAFLPFPLSSLAPAKAGGFSLPFSYVVAAGLCLSATPAVPLLGYPPCFPIPIFLFPLPPLFSCCFLLFFAESCCPLPAYRPARARGILAANARLSLLSTLPTILPAPFAATCRRCRLFPISLFFFAALQFPTSTIPYWHGSPAAAPPCGSRAFLPFAFLSCHPGGLPPPAALLPFPCNSGMPACVHVSLSLPLCGFSFFSALFPLFLSLSPGYRCKHR